MTITKTMTSSASRGVPPAAWRRCVHIRNACPSTIPSTIEIGAGDIPPGGETVYEFDATPYGLGTYASRSTPVGGAATAMVSRKLRDKARKLAAHLLEISEEDIEWELGRFYVRSQPDRGVSIQECAMAAYSNMPDGMEPGLENPLGARALYIFQDGRDTLYRVHGNQDERAIGRAVSSGCVRLLQQDVIDLHRRVPSGSPILVV